jgi:plasmid stabilization system protein ParE
MVRHVDSRFRGNDREALPPGRLVVDILQQTQNFGGQQARLYCHILAYRVVEERTIEIGRILHEGRDFERRLPSSQ